MILALTIIGGVAFAGVFFACCAAASHADEMYYKYKYGGGEDDRTNC